MVNTWTWCRECCTPESNRHPGPRHQESAPPRDSQDRHCYGQPQGPSMTWNAGRLLKVAMAFRNNGLPPVLDLHLGEGDGDVEDAPHLLPPPHQQTRQHPRTLGLCPAPIRDQYLVLVSRHLTNQGSVFDLTCCCYQWNSSACLLCHLLGSWVCWCTWRICRTNSRIVFVSRDSVLTNQRPVL